VEAERVAQEESPGAAASLTKDPIGEGLRSALETTANAEAKQTWAVFDAERRRLIESGGDHSKNTEAVGKLEALGVERPRRRCSPASAAPGKATCVAWR
jgi:hypothetical protein